MEIFLIRHGQSVQNTGDKKIVDPKVYLTEEGIKEARETGNFLFNYVLNKKDSLRNSCMWISPYKRTVQTSIYINQFLNIDKQIYDSNLIEQDYGIYSNLTVSERRDKYPELFELEDDYYKNGCSFYLKKPCGESPLEVKNRTRFVLDKILESNYDYNFIISHGIAIKTLIMNYLETYDNLNELDYKWYAKESVPRNCSVISLKDGDYKHIYKKPFNKKIY